MGKLLRISLNPNTKNLILLGHYKEALSLAKVLTNSKQSSHQK
jgi:hypothetical protein